MKENFLTEKELDELYFKWKNNMSLSDDIEKQTTPYQLAHINAGLQYRYYTEFPLNIPPTSRANHFNGLKLIGVEDYKLYNTYMVVLLKTSGKTYHFVLQWAIERYKKYGEMFCILRRRDMEIKDLLQDVRGNNDILYNDFNLKGKILYDKITGKKAGRFDSLSSISSGSNSESYTNIFFDEFISTKFDPIHNEAKLLTIYMGTMFRDRRFIGRLIMAANSHTINNVYLDRQNLDFTKFTRKNPIVKIYEKFGKRLWIMIGFGIKFNNLNTSVGCTPLASFSNEQERDFIEKGTFSFDNKANFWDRKSFVVMEINAIYKFKNEIFYECIGFHRKLRIRKIVLIPQRQMDSNIEDLNQLPIYALTSNDIAESEGIDIHRDLKGLSTRWMRQILNEKLKLSGLDIKEILKEFFVSIDYFNNYELK